MADSLFDSGFTEPLPPRTFGPTMAVGSQRPDQKLPLSQEQQQHSQPSDLISDPTLDASLMDDSAPPDPTRANITVRALVSSKEAGAIIGKAGRNVADLREQTQVKAGVSKPVLGVPDRVLTISGLLDNVAEAYSLAAGTLAENPPTGSFVHSLSPPPPPGIATIRLLIFHQQMGTIIGRQGLKIKLIQESCKVRIVASKDMLPNSTERIVEIQGTPLAVKAAVWEIGKCLIEDWERAAGSIPYNPVRSASSSNTGPGGHQTDVLGSGNSSSGNPIAPSSSRRLRNPSSSVATDENVQQISIPSDMVGCIIGKGGIKIQEIRRSSGARISIAKEPYDDSGERLFTIQGSQPATERALYLLYEQLELEKGRRGSSQ